MEDEVKQNNEENGRILRSKKAKMSQQEEIHIKCEPDLILSTPFNEDEGKYYFFQVNLSMSSLSNFWVSLD